MTYTLSLNNILDTLYAMAALHTLTTDSPEPILDPDRSGPVRLIVRNAFADVCLRLVHHIVDCNLDGETSSTDNSETPPTDDSDIMMSLTLALPRDFNPSMHGVLRRNLEQAVALTALATILFSQNDIDRAETTLATASGHISAASSLLTARKYTPIRWI